ncbi:MAG: hypothetical protein WKG32_20890 [Gemmatimonadaceae bacterium]
MAIIPRRPASMRGVPGGRAGHDGGWAQRGKEVVERPADRAMEQSSDRNHRLGY